MKYLNSMGLKHVDNELFVLDQTLLPEKETWLRISEPHEMVEAIKSLRVRGAPLIGVAAALTLAKYAQVGVAYEKWRSAAHLMREARPTAVNLMNAVDRMLNIPFDPARLVSEAESIFDEDVILCEDMANHGSALINNGEGILTHCNTGGLATAGLGTALAVIVRAHEQGKRIHVFVDETRPLLQGGRLTTWELEKRKIPYTLICDNMAATLMRQGRIQKVFVGADRIAMNGDFANKIGTYSVAVQAHHHGIQFFPVAPETTIDKFCRSGAEIPVEERNADEVRGVSGTFGDIKWTPLNASVFNPSFDVTPVELITGLVLNRGYLTQAQLFKGALASKLTN